MKSNKYLLTTFVFASLFVFNLSNASAESISTSTNQDNDSNSVDIYFPIKMDDFMILYGVTNDKDTDKDILDLRTQFNKDYLDLKQEYQDALKKKIGDKTLSIPSSYQEKDDKVSSSSKKTLNIQKKTNTLAKSSAVKVDNNIIDPTINSVNYSIIDSSATNSIRIENKGWFSKLKNLFK